MVTEYQVILSVYKGRVVLSISISVYKQKWPKLCFWPRT